ncbi:quinone oxidoreductase family protein [Aerosakkonema funiforme]|uniref:quinone oxidoreductase family protein n=1 Tax=Aerosakkonema funiforme TaxID=1246630 RepID=UPI0035B85FF1
MKAILVKNYGGSEQLQLTEVPQPEISPVDILIKLEAAGVNFVDVYERSGVYSNLQLPYIPGKEGAGVVVGKGEMVKNFAIGERVAFPYINCGSYAEYVAIPASQAVSLPAEIDFITGAGCLLQGLTAHFLTHDTFRLGTGHTALIHAAAGGVGLLAVQMAKLRGATVIGTVSTEIKAQMVKKAGADYVIRYDQEDFVSAVMDWTDGVGVDVVYDSVGVATFNRSLQILKSRGLLVVFGQSSGVVPAVDLNSQLGNRDKERGSFYITRPVIRHYIGDELALKSRADELFKYIITEAIKVLIGYQYELSSAKKAHDDLEKRLTIGKSILRIPF